MKRSIKVAALALFATSLLGGCSNGGPAEQKITVSPESLVVYTGESFTLESNVSNATWSLEDNEIGAQLSAVEGKSVQVSATIAGTVVAVAKAEGYTTPKVTLTFEYRAQQISVTPASGEVFRDESFSLETNASTATWSLEGNTAGAELSATSGKNVTVTATGAGVAVAVATADGYTQARVTLKFNELKDQTISSNPESGEAFVGKSISLTTNADIAGWTLSENTAGAVLDYSSGKTVTVTGSEIGSVTVTAKAANYKDAALRLSFVEPHWTEEEEAIMEETLHGQVIPYAQGAGLLSLSESGGIVRVNGSSISAENLVAYASLFTEAAGWVDQEESENPYEYSFEKCIPTAEGNRYVYVYFGSFDSAGNGVENGDFFLASLDPYDYEFPTFDFELAKVILGIESEVEVPALEADHYSFNETYSAALVYSAEAADLEAAYAAVLAQASDFVDYGYDDSLGVSVVEEKTGAFSLIYYQIDSTCLVIQMEKGAIYQHEWPAELLAQYCLQVLGSETVVPAFEAPRYYAEYLPTYGVIGMTCYDFESETPIEDYAAILEEAGWTYFGQFGSATTGFFYMADSPDGKVGVQFSLSEEGNLEIYVLENNFDHVFPAEQFAAALAAQGIETEVSVPGVEAGGYSFFSDEDGAGVYCYLVKEDPTAAYLQALVDAGWSIFDMSDEEMVVYAADASDYSFGIQFTYFAEEEVFAIFLSETYRDYGHEWPETYAMLISILIFNSYDILPAPEVEAEWYILDFDYPLFICEGVESDPSESYTATLVEAGFTLLPSETYDEVTYYFANSSDVAYGVVYWYEEGNFNIQMTDPFNVELDEFPHNDIVANFAEFGVEEVNLPSFTIAAEDGYFELDVVALAQGAYVLYAYGATSEEYSSYIEALEAAGWVIVEEDNGERDYSKDVVLQYGETYAFCEIMDFTEEYDAVAMAFYYEEPVVFPSEEINADLAAAGATDTLPAFSGEAAGYNYYSGSSGRQLTIVVAEDSSEAATIAQYQADLLAAGYTEAGKDIYGDMHYTSPNGEIDVVAWAGSDIGYTGYVFVDIEIDVAPLPASWPTSDIEAYFAEYGYTDPLPEYIGDASALEFDYDWEEIWAYTTECATWLEAYAAVLEEAGFTLYSGSIEDLDVQYVSPNEQYIVNVYTYEYGAVYIAFYEVPSSEFPSETIDADLEALGLKDTLPAFTGEEAIGYDWACNDSYIELDILVAAGDEAKAVAQYQADLLAAGYTEAGEDKWGDMHYTSPNGELDVVAWDGSTEGYDGYVVVNIEVNEVTPVEEGMSPKEIADAVAPWFGLEAEELEGGAYGFINFYDAADPDNNIPDMVDYFEYVIAYEGNEEFEALVEWSYDESGNAFALYQNEAGTFVEIYFTNTIIYVDSEGYIVPPETEGATAVEVIEVEFVASDSLGQE